MRSTFISNPILDKLPDHLRQFIKPQNYDHYTNENQAVWRYVMRKNIAELSKLAHPMYVKGLKKTGISIEHIPSMYGMNRILKEIGWAAAAVDGFIPPSAFMEFQAYNVLVIAADIRKLENIEYTPTPDIIHEAAGHAPIIANPEYAEYLRRMGDLGAKAISSAYDWSTYEAVRKVSQLKESMHASTKEIEEAEKELDELLKLSPEFSEMAKLRNLQWWTVEYGLVGTLEDYKIYGAGLLSSIGECEWCLRDEVKKIPYTVEAANQGFDITKPQPQLFVTPDFVHLSRVQEEFADTMAVRTGGKKGLSALIESTKLGTIELSTGLQISGVFMDAVFNEHGDPVLFRTQGETALAFRDKELIGHSIKEHSDGFVSPIGKLKGINMAIENMSPRDLEAYNIIEGKKIKLEFEANVSIEGRVLTGTRNIMGKILLIHFEDCTLYHRDKVLFTPEDGKFSMAVGQDIVSAFAGPADLNSFNLIHHKLSESIIHQFEDEYSLVREELYDKIRQYREKNKNNIQLESLFTIAEKYKSEWLIWLELHELALIGENQKLQLRALHVLTEIKENKLNLRHLIYSGLKNNQYFLNHPAVQLVS